MTTALVSKEFVAGFGDAFKAVAERAGKSADFITLPEKAGARLSQADCERIDCTFLDREIRFREGFEAAYSDAIMAAKNAKWMHVASSGVNRTPYIFAMDERGAIITTSTGSNAEPVAQTGMTLLLMLARGFTTYVPAQHKREWRPLRGEALPDDLRGQTLLLIGLGSVGKKLAGF